MEQYNFNTAKYGTHALIAKELGNNKKILDVGCNKGYLKKLAPANDFYGIDFDKADLQQAKSDGYLAVYQLDLNKYQSFVCDCKFDTIIFADVLEHLNLPSDVLNFFFSNFLKENGQILISLPNVANIATRLGLLFGNFDYTESGILDKTHLHLYTKKTAKMLIVGSGIKIVKEKFSSNNFGWIIEKFPFLGGLLGFNLIFVCKK